MLRKLHFGKLFKKEKNNLVRNKNFYILLVGIFLAALGSILYFLVGYSILIPLLWILSIAITGTYFYKKPKSKRNFKEIKYDLLIIILLIIFFAPLYFYNLYEIPYQVNGDEIVIMSWQKKLTNGQHDIFSLSDYWGFPSLVFVFTGSIGKLLGGVNLLNSRLVHAFFGLLIIPSSYVLFRTIARRKIAIGGAIILGTSHTLVAVSRAAMRDNLALLGGILALTLWLYGLKKKSYLHIFIGGCFAGLNWYGYYPGRSTIVVLFLFSASLFIFSRHKYRFQNILKIASVIFLGFALVTLPLLTTTIKQKDEHLEGSMYFQKMASLLYPEGRQLQKEWFDAKSTSEGIKINIINGLTIYNNFVEDTSSNYWNPGHGFLDPLTGIFLWIGFLVIFFKRKKDEKSFLFLIGFLFYLLLFSSIVNRSPNYLRSLVTLPFVCYLAAVGLNKLSTLIEKLQKKFKINQNFHLRTIVFIIFLIGIIFWNFTIFQDHYKRGFNGVNEVGATIRHMEERSNNKEHSFYLLGDNKKYKYYHHGNFDMEHTYWFINSVKGNNQAQVLPPDETHKIKSPPFTIFMTDNLWNVKKDTLTQKYPNFTIHKTKAYGNRVAIEVK